MRWPNRKIFVSLFVLLFLFVPLNSQAADSQTALVDQILDFVIRFYQLCAKGVDLIDSTILLAITAIATAAAAGAAFWAAWEARKSAKETWRAARGNLLSQLLLEYGSREMLEAMRKLRELQQDNPGGFTNEYATLRKNRDKDGYELDEYRRQVSHYFNKVRILCQEDLIEKELVEKGLGVASAEFLLEVVEPLEEVHGRIILGSTYDPGTFNYFRCRYGLDIGPPISE